MLRGLFDHKKSLPSNLRMSIHMSLMEFTPTTSIDLLKKPPSNLGTCQNRNATRIRVKSMEHALELLYLGKLFRHSISSPYMNSLKLLKMIFVLAKRVAAYLVVSQSRFILQLQMREMLR